jgi:hypothetical protein
VVALNVKHEEHVLRALADTGASSSIILEAYTSKDIIKQDKDIKSTWCTMNGQFTTDKTGIVTFCFQNLTSRSKLLGSFMWMADLSHGIHME